MREPVNVMLKPPAAREADKNSAQRAEDIAYTINHALSCGLNDMIIAPSIAALFGVQVGCSDPSHHHGTHDNGHHGHDHHGHDHHGHEGHNHPVFPSPFPTGAGKKPTPRKAKFVADVPPEPHNHTHGEPHIHAPRKFSWKNLNWNTIDWKTYRSEALHYLKGEIIGDAAAVPLTIATQRLFPSLMEGLRRVIEPITAPFFCTGANAAAAHWGKRHGFGSDAPEVIEKAHAMYDREMQHLPQAVMWNLYAFPIGVVTQKLSGHDSSYARIIRNKSIGAIISNTLLLGSRALAPGIAQQWDAMNSRSIIAPVTGAAMQAFGANPAPAPWVERVEQGPPTVRTP